jgi:hypothetical protein
MEKLKEQQNAKQEADPLKWPTNLDPGNGVFMAHSWEMGGTTGVSPGSGL